MRNSEDTLPPYVRASTRGLPRPSASFKVRAWREFQKALDPLAPPKPLRQPRG